jgi:hypothetical protein
MARGDGLYGEKCKTAVIFMDDVRGYVIAGDYAKNAAHRFNPYFSLYALGLIELLAHSGIPHNYPCHM